MSLYEDIGAERVEKILRTFYLRCFEDVMIGHFFFEKNHEELLKHQLTFTIGMLGGPVSYQGRALTLVHNPLPIRPPQFARRRMILIETMQDEGLDQGLIESWISLEEKLKSLILKDQSSCQA
jgi:truncated hemoglobin YjbI